MRALLFIVLLLALQVVAVSQLSVRQDSSIIAERKFVSREIAGYKSDPVFRYDRIKESPPSLWDQFWGWFWEKVNGVLRNKTGKRTLVTVLALLAICVLVYFVLKMRGMTRTNLFSKDTAGNPAGKLQENIHDIDFDNAIREAADDKNFRLAVRLLYLQSIKFMADRGLIDWQFNKTNVQYIEELSGSGHELAFSELTFRFEKNWYGDFPVRETEYASVKEQFVQFNRQIQ